MNPFNQKLKSFFRHKNLSKISRDLKIPRSLLQDWVTYNRLPSMRNMFYVRKLAVYFKIPMENLIFGDSDPDEVQKFVFQDKGVAYEIIIYRKKNEMIEKKEINLQQSFDVAGE